MTDDHQQPTPVAIAVDPNYRVRDNQFWYNDCVFADVIRNRATITVRIDGLGTRTLRHSAVGTDGRPTPSFTFLTRADRDWWEQYRDQRVRVELISLDEEALSDEPNPAEATLSAVAHSSATSMELIYEPGQEQRTSRAAGPVVCIGLDIAWFGGSASDPWSRYDCVGSVLLGNGGLRSTLGLTRVSLGGRQDRDPLAQKTLAAIKAVLDQHSNARRVVLALDAPIQAINRPKLPTRKPNLKKGENGSIARRACEDQLEIARKIIGRRAQNNDWRPNIQAGAPLASRVQNLLTGLNGLGFTLWAPSTNDAGKLVIECFPAEAIWAAKCQEKYASDLSVTCVKAYKRQKSSTLTIEQISNLVHNALDAFADPCGDPDLWPSLVNDALCWMRDDVAWQYNGGYRGGKLLDDVVDTLICLATAMSFVNGCAHVWRDPQKPGDGHIIGPGCPQDNPWIGSNETGSGP